MKSKHLNKAGNFIMLSGEIDKNFTIAPGVKVTFGEGSTFEGIEVAKGTTFCNNEYIVKRFALNLLGRIELTPISKLSDQDHDAQGPSSNQGVKKSLALIISPSNHSSVLEQDSLLELGLPEELMYKRPLAPTAEKELWASSPPASPPSIIEPDSPLPQPDSPPPPTLHAELTAHPSISLHEALRGDLYNEQVLSGQNHEESACCCSIS